MNDLEFREQYKRLKEVHPHRFESAEKLSTVWRFVKDMDIQWFTSLTDRIVMSSKGDLDIGEAVTFERRNRKSKEFADDVCKAVDTVRKLMTDDGLDRVLGKYKAGSLIDAIEKSRKGEV